MLGPDGPLLNAKLAPLPPFHSLSARDRSLQEIFGGPTPRSNWIIPGRLLCGGAPHEYIGSLVRAGVTCFVSLQSKGEAHPYRDGVLKLNASAVFDSQPIMDQSVTADGLVVALAARILRRVRDGECVYVHCKGGHGRTGTVCSIVLGLAYSLDGPRSLLTLQALHDLRMQPTFAASEYDPTDDGASCIALFAVQRQQVLRLLGVEAEGEASAGDKATADAASEAAAEAVEAHRQAAEVVEACGAVLTPRRGLSDTYGAGASKYDEVVLRESKSLGDSAAAAARAHDWETASRLFRQIVDLRPDWNKARECLARSMEREALLSARAEAAAVPAVERREDPAAALTRAHSSGPAPAARPRAALGKHVPSLVVLVGLPGAGKSTFCAALAASSETWCVVSQDELGSRADFENELVAALKVKGARVVADRCNVKPEDRTRLLERCFHPEGAVAVHFITDKEECIRRVAGRTGHPTIGYGRGRPAVESMAQALRAPSVSEGFAAVHTVDSARAVAALLRKWGAEPVSVPPAGFFKFPRTRHVLYTSGVARDDLVMDPAEAAGFFDGRTTVTAEEKVDGANLGISLTSTYEIRAQNRAHFVNAESHQQFRPLSSWLDEHAWALCQLLTPEHEVLFGEWCYAKHSVPYTTLPGYFLAFDIYDKRTGKFCSAQERDRRLEGLDIPSVRCIAARPFNGKEDLLQLLESPSAYGDGFVEGAYLRIDSADGNTRRGKIVRPDFIQAITEHWMSKDVVRQGVRPDLWEDGRRLPARGDSPHETS